MKESRTKKQSEADSEISAWVTKSRKIEKKKALQLSKIFEEQDNIAVEGSDDEDTAQHTENLAGLKVLHGLDKVMEGGTVVLTIKDQPILADGDVNEDVDMLENIEIGEQKQRDEAYKAAKKKTGVYDDKFNDDPFSEKKMLPQYDDPVAEEGVTLDEKGRFSGEAEKKLEELRRRLSGVSTNTFEDLTSYGKVSSDYYTHEEMLKFKKPKKKKSLRKKDKLDIKALEAEAVSSGLGVGDLGSRSSVRRQAIKEEQERLDAKMRSNAYQSAYAKADEASKLLREQTLNVKTEDDETPAFVDDDEDLRKSLEKARRLALKKHEEGGASGPQAIALLATSNHDNETDSQNPTAGESRENKVVFTEMEEFVWGLHIDEEARKPERSHSQNPKVSHTLSEYDFGFFRHKMPAKDGGSDKEKCLDLFLKIGLDERTARNTVANNKVTANLTSVINEAGVTDGCSRTVGNLLYTVATKYPANALPHRPTLLQYIVSSKVKTTAQLDAALSFLASTGLENLDSKTFEEACGVGVEVSTEDIKQAVSEVVEENKSTILELRYRTNVGELLGHVRKRLPWGDAKVAKQLVDAKLYELLGDRTAADDEKPSKKKKEKPAKVEDKAPVATPEKSPEEDVNPYLIFPNPVENFKVHTEVPFSDGSILRCCNTRALLDKHLKATGGKVLTRFPPEPNGYLHIGHAKAMFIDFGLAKDRDGGCYLRYDDTNPEAEKKEYIDHIEEIVQWMGWKPFKITYTSDYFQELYELAVELIKKGHAYVDHQTPDEIKEYREKKMNSPWRDRPISESLKLFEDMKNGLVEEGKAILRMKQDMQSDNYNMYDLIAYRIKFTPHPHAGDKWCIYPSYDYAHCIVDSLENITHSLCTLEFETRRASYYWLLHALGIYQPYVWEYSRLNVSNTVMSKRKLNRLVTEKWVDGWDDPRLMTLAGLRRRGMSPTAINAFVRGIGITRSDGTLISIERLEYHVREELNRTAPRAMVVLHPLKVVITNLEANPVIEVDAKIWPDAKADDASAFYKIPFSNVVYIEHSDFRMQDSKDYYGLAPGKSAILRYAFPIKCTEVILADDNETILEIRAEYDPSKKTKPKGVLHWVPQPSPGVDPLKVEVRLFERLFVSENPAELDNWLGDLNPNSKVIIPDAYGVSSLQNAKVGDNFQFERLGYFVVDRDSTPEKLVFNRTVTLKDSYSKGGK